MTIKEARQQAGLTQAKVSLLFGIPKRTLEDWETGKRTPSEWVVNLVVDKILNWNKPQFKINNESVKNYADMCKKFAKDTAEWGGLDNYKFYTTSKSYEQWEESSDNANNGIDISWAFHLSDEEIEMRSAEELLEDLMNELDLAVSEEYEIEQIEEIYKKFNI